VHCARFSACVPQWPATWLTGKADHVRDHARSALEGSSPGGAGCLISVTELEPELAAGLSNAHVPSHRWLDMHGLMIHQRDVGPGRSCADVGYRGGQACLQGDRRRQCRACRSSSPQVTAGSWQPAAAARCSALKTPKSSSRHKESCLPLPGEVVARREWLGRVVPIRKLGMTDQLPSWAGGQCRSHHARSPRSCRPQAPRRAGAVG